LRSNLRFSQFHAYISKYVLQQISREAGIMAILCEGQNVRHNKKAEWGIGKIIAVERCGTIRVIFEGTNELSIAKGLKYLTKVEEKEGK